MLNWFAVPSMQTIRALPDGEHSHLLVLELVEPMSADAGSTCSLALTAIGSILPDAGISCSLLLDDVEIMLVFVIDIHGPGSI